MVEAKNIFSVFLLEDDIMYQKMLAYMLDSDPGLELSFFQTGLGLLEQLDRQLPDIIIMDYSLPDLSGQQILAILQERELIVPVVVLSGSVNPATIAELFEKGIYEFIAKDALTRVRLQNVLNNLKALLCLQAENRELRGRG